jgi:hypothetical protein
LFVSSIIADFCRIGNGLRGQKLTIFLFAAAKSPAEFPQGAMYIDFSN